ncbi:carbamoyltransferase HypF [Helicobacter sp. 16-1353]|uniref:carbamoyltransferase HypF n=1 Tax=Helicobacter sp. 16-1353 TaxID=2004996 RepID=UPI0015EEC31B|nr:carbamoyltransferase HypF [Helicobacter sp. 16-1353]
MQTCKINIYGIVQGVGFRPFIYNLANEFALKGYVKNVGSGVEIVIQDKLEKNITYFIKAIPLRIPQNAIISNIFIKKIKSKIIYKDFTIKKSTLEIGNLIYSAIPQDLAICNDCLREFNSTSNRRHLYAFINCINCGPRYSIIKSLPYDRKNTAMSNFVMCEICNNEYNNTMDRRFHAQPNSCHKCGISLSIFDKNAKDCNENLDSSNKSKKIPNVESPKDRNICVIKQAQNLIYKNKILAIKGIGGFNFVCKIDFNVIDRLRILKNRPSKPFAIMFRDLAHLKRYFHISDMEEKTLNNPISPILLLKNPKITFPSNLAPNLDTIGVIIAYSPLHKLLFRNQKKPLIFTSANLSGEPLVTTKDEAFKKIANVFDYLVDYNRDIINPIDDSVNIILENKKRILLRAARGYYPLSVKIDFYTSSVILALGANQKNQIAIFYKNFVIISPFIGDLESVDSINLFQQTINLFLDIYKLKPAIILCDAHSQYQSSKIALSLSSKFNAKLFRIYHHRAHFYSVLFDNNIYKKDRILGIIFDGTGFGEDNNIWGGVFFIKEKNTLKRILHFKYFPIIGDNNYIRDNKKIVAGILFSIFGNKILDELPIENINIYYQIYKQNLNCFLTSSVGRIFDFVAFFCGVEKQSYEGESGMIIESLYDKNITESYKYEIIHNEIILDSMFREILQDYKYGEKVKIASKFINTLVAIVVDVIVRENAIVVFSGGVFQNKILCDRLICELNKRKIIYYMHDKIPPNDGGIAFGQIAAYLSNDYLR